MDKSVMDIRIRGLHLEALQRLMKINGHSMPVHTLRELIAAAAKREGVWPTVELESEETERQTA